MSLHEMYILALRQYREYQRMCETSWRGSEKALTAMRRREWRLYADSVFAYRKAGGTKPLPCFGA